MARLQSAVLEPPRKGGNPYDLLTDDGQPSKPTRNQRRKAAKKRITSPCEDVSKQSHADASQERVAASLEEIVASFSDHGGPFKQREKQHPERSEPTEVSTIKQSPKEVMRRANEDQTLLRPAKSPAGQFIACHTVLSTTELLENILEHLPPSNSPNPPYVRQFAKQPAPQLDLFVFMRINKQFRDVITTSPTLKKLCWMSQPEVALVLPESSEEKCSWYDTYCTYFNQMVRFREPGGGYGGYRLWESRYVTARYDGDGLSGPQELQLFLLPISIQGPVEKHSWHDMYLSHNPHDLVLNIKFDTQRWMRLRKKQGRVMKWKRILVTVKPAPFAVYYKMARKLYAMAQRRAGFCDVQAGKTYTLQTKWLSDEEKGLVVEAPQMVMRPIYDILKY